MLVPAVSLFCAIPYAGILWISEGYAFLFFLLAPPLCAATLLAASLRLSLSRDAHAPSSSMLVLLSFMTLSGGFWGLGVAFFLFLSLLSFSFSLLL